MTKDETMQFVTLVGRFDSRSPVVSRFSWPNSAIGFSFEGNGIGIVLSNETMPLKKKGQLYNMYEVVLDGEVLAPIVVASTTPQTYFIDAGILPGPHTAWIIKRTEANMGRGLLHGLEVPPDTMLLPPPPRRDRRIEVYGASNEAGYGSLGKATRKNMCRYTPQTQNAAAAYPALAARALGADLVNISFSCKGMVGTCEASDTESLPALLERIDPMDPESWPQDVHQAPQLVMVTLGPNDFGALPPDRAAFHHAYGSFLRKIRRRYSQAHILCTVSPMMRGEYRVIYRQWLTTIVANTRDARVSLVEFPAYTGDTYGCDYHPDMTLHEELAVHLRRRITEITGWQ